MEKHKWIIRLVLSILIVQLLGAFLPPPLNIGVQTAKATPTPNTVGQSTHASAVAFAFQRKGFHASGRFWAWYYNGSNLGYTSSADGVSWPSLTTITTDVGFGYFLSVDFNGTHLAYVYRKGGECFYRLGTPNSDGSISWSADEQNAVQPSPNAYFVTICFDSDGYPYIGHMGTTYVGNKYPQVSKSSERNGTWVMASGFPYNLTTSISDTFWSVSVIPLTGGKVYAIYALDGYAVKGKLWNGTAWGDEETASSSLTQYGYYHSAVAQGDDVHLVFLNKTTYDIIYVKRTWGVGWGSEVVVQASTTSTSIPALSINTANNNLYCFWAGSPTAHHIYYKKCVSGTWDSSPTDWIDESTDQLGNSRLTAFRQSYSNKIGLFYVAKTSSPFDVKFDYLDMGMVPSIGEFSSPSYTIYADSYFLLNATINDIDGLADFVNATIDIGNDVILKWENSTNTFSEQSDPNNYCALNASESTQTQINSTAYRLSWKIKLSPEFCGDYAGTPVSIVGTNTKVFDSGGLSGSNSYSALFYLERDKPSNTAFPSTVGSSKEDWCITQCSEAYARRGNFYASGLYWVWYSDSANLVFKTSSDGLNWSNATKIGPCAFGFRFSAIFDGTHIHYTRYHPEDLYYRKGTPNSDGTITWLTPEQTVYDGNSTNIHCNPALEVDSGGYPWIGTTYFIWLEGNMSYPYVFKSSLNNGTWQTQMGFPYQLSTTTNLVYWRVAPIPLREGKVYVVYGKPNESLRGQLWNGTAFGNEETITTSYLDGVTGGSFCAVSQGDHVHLVFIDNASLYIRYVKRTYESGWGSEVVLVPWQMNWVSLNIDPANDVLRVIWGGEGGVVYYKRCIAGVWDPTPTEWFCHVNNRYLIFYPKVCNNEMTLIYWAPPTYWIGQPQFFIRFNALHVYFNHYAIETPPKVTLSDLKWEPLDMTLTMTAEGEGTQTIKVRCDEKPYYVRINGVMYPEGTKWTYVADCVVITVEFSSTRTILISWASLPPPSEGGPGTAPPPEEKPLGPIETFVETVIKPIVLQINTYWIGVMIVGFMLLGTAYAKREDENLLATILGAIAVLLVVNYLVVFILVPMNLLPPDLVWMQRLAWTPPSLQLELYGLPTESLQLVQMGLLGSLIILFIVSAYIMTTGE